jgi:hypothetical protein
MTAKRVVLLLGAVLLGAMLVIGAVGVAHPIGAERAAPRPLSDRALSIIGAVDPAARVRPQDLQCNVKVPWGLAQCGSQASSCKNCHEVKGEDSVNAKGDWHVAHAFGDFCEFCHGGNVQATDEAAAHQGLVQPLDDVKTNCSSCHADNYQAKAETYAKTLDVTLGAATGGSTQPPAQPPTDSSTTSNTAAQPAQVAQPAAAQPKPAATPTSNEITDYVAQYRAEKPKPMSPGTIFTGLLLGLTMVGGGSFMVWNEKRLRSMPRPVASATTPDERSQEMGQLQPLLAKMDAETLRALRTLLSKRS